MSLHMSTGHCLIRILHYSVSGEDRLRLNKVKKKSVFLCFLFYFHYLCYRGNSHISTMTEKVFTFEELHITSEDIYRQMGDVSGMADRRLLAEIEHEANEVAKVVVPRMCYVVKYGKLGDHQLETDGVVLNIGKTIARQLAGAEAFAFFVATAGMEFEDYQRRLSNDGDMVRAYIADSLGSLIAEHTADMMERTVEASVSKLGWHHTNRFSPGYCSWHVAGQHALFSLIGDNPCGVTLNESALMVPIKSVSGIMGLGAEVKRLDYPCQLCGMTNCRLRRS